MESWQTDGWNQIINPLIGSGMNNEAYFSTQILSVCSVSPFPWVTFLMSEPLISLGRNFKNWSFTQCHILSLLFFLSLSSAVSGEYSTYAGSGGGGEF